MNADECKRIVDECKNKADECLAAAHYVSDRDFRRTWRQLAEMWQLWAEHLEFHSAHGGKAVLREDRAGLSSAGAGKASINRAVEQFAERLRSRLALNAPDQCNGVTDQYQQS